MRFLLSQLKATVLDYQVESQSHSRDVIVCVYLRSVLQCCELQLWGHLQFTILSEKTGNQNQYILVFPSPGRNVPITVDLLKKKSPSNRCSVLTERTGIEDQSAYDVEGSGEEVRSFVDFMKFNDSVTRYFIHRSN